MPLSEPQERKLLHSRDIALRGYQRGDGLFDIEAHLTDIKSYGFDLEDRGWIEPGEPLHGMWLRMTVDEASPNPRLRGGLGSHALYDLPGGGPQFCPARRPRDQARVSARKQQPAWVARRDARICANCSSRSRRSPFRPSTRSVLGRSARRRHRDNGRR